MASSAVIMPCILGIVIKFPQKIISDSPNALAVIKACWAKVKAVILVMLYALSPKVKESDNIKKTHCKIL